MIKAISAVLVLVFFGACSVSPVAERTDYDQAAKDLVVNAYLLESLQDMPDFRERGLAELELSQRERLGQQVVLKLYRQLIRDEEASNLFVSYFQKRFSLEQLIRVNYWLQSTTGKRYAHLNYIAQQDFGSSKMKMWLPDKYLMRDYRERRQLAQSLVYQYNLDHQLVKMLGEEANHYLPLSDHLSTAESEKIMEREFSAFTGQRNATLVDQIVDTYIFSFRKMELAELQEAMAFLRSEDGRAYFEMGSSVTDIDDAIYNLVSEQVIQANPSLSQK